MNYTKQVLVGLAALLVLATLMGAASAAALTFSGAELPDSYEVIETDADENEIFNVTTTDQTAYFNLTTDTNGTTTTVYVNGIVPYYADTSVFAVRTPATVDAQPYAFVAKIFVNNATEESIVEARAKETGTLEIFPMLVDNKGHAYFYYVGFANVDANDSGAWDEAITMPFVYIFENQSEMEKNASNPALIVDFKLNATPEKVPGLIDVRNEWLSVETDEESGETATTSPVFDEGKLGDNLKNVSQPLGINYQLDENAVDEEGNPLDNVYTVYVTGTIPFYSQDPTSLGFDWEGKELTNLAVLQIIVRNAADGATLTVEDDDLAEVKLVSEDAFAGTIEPDFDYIFAAFAFPNDEEALDPEEYPRTVTFTADGTDGTLTLNFDFSGCTFATAPTPVLRKATVDFFRPGWGNQDGLYLEEPNFGFEAVEISEDEMDYVIILDGTIPYSADDYTGLWKEYNEPDTDGENYKNMFTIKLYIDGAVDNVFGDRLNVLSAAEIESSSAGQTYALSEVMDGYGRDDVRLLYLVGYMAEDENGTVNFWNNTTYNGVVSGNTEVPANRWTIDNGYGKTMNIYVINKADLETVSDITFVLFGNSKASSLLSKTYAPAEDADASSEPEGTPEAAVLVYDREAKLVGAQWADEGMATFTLPDGDYTYVVRFNRGLYEEEYGMIGSAADFDDVSEWVYKSESFNTADATEGQIAVNLESTVRFFNAYGQAIDPTYKVVDLISGIGSENDDENDKTYDTVALNQTAIDIYDASGRILIATREMGDYDYYYNGIDAGSLSINLADGNYMYKMYRATPGEYVITSDGAIAQALVYPNAPRIGYLPTDLIPFNVNREELQIKQINSTLELGFENYFFVYDRDAAINGLMGDGIGDMISGVNTIASAGIAGANITITDGNNTYVAMPKYLADESTSYNDNVVKVTDAPTVNLRAFEEGSSLRPMVGLYSVYLPLGEYTFTVEADGYGYGKKAGKLTVDEDALLELFPSGTSAADVFARVIGMTENDMGFAVYNSGDRALDDATVMIWTSDLDKNLDAPIATDLTGVANAGSHGWSEFGTERGYDMDYLHYDYTVITAQPASLYFNKYVNGSDYESTLDEVMTDLGYYGVPEDVIENIRAYCLYEPMNQSQLPPVNELPFSTFDEFVYWIDFYYGLSGSETAEGLTPIVGEQYLPNDNCLLWHVEKDNSSRDEDDELYTDVYPFVSNGQNRVVVPLTQTYKVTICVWEETVLGDLPINTATFQNLDKVSKTPSVQKGN